MNTATHWFPGRLTEMSAGECRQLLLATSVGRVVFVDELGPTALPVNYVLDEDNVLFRTSAHNTLGRHLDGATVALEVDDFEDYTQSGWSVLVRGIASFVPHDDLPDGGNQPYPWPDGVRTLMVQITPESVTGRRLLPV
ncbi:MAG: pyridoxamine 5'-phosphate oxidase family protein [Nocardioides sp.]